LSGSNQVAPPSPTQISLNPPNPGGTTPTQSTNFMAGLSQFASAQPLQSGPHHLTSPRATDDMYEKSDGGYFRNKSSYQGAAGGDSLNFTGVRGSRAGQFMGTVNSSSDGQRKSNSNHRHNNGEGMHDGRHRTSQSHQQNYRGGGYTTGNNMQMPMNNNSSAYADQEQ
jgi:hypothetical protein